MKRKLTAREWTMLGILAVLVLVVGYIVLFYMPTTAARDAALADTETCKQQTETAQARLSEKRRMERELDEIFAQDPNPRALADYDNLQPIMMDLNTILAPTQNYSLSFATVDADQSIIRREISISYTCDSYDTAKTILRMLHNGAYRCMLNNLTISRGQGDGGSTSVSGSIVFFECQP